MFVFYIIYVIEDKEVLISWFILKGIKGYDKGDI